MEASKFDEKVIKSLSVNTKDLVLMNDGTSFLSDKTSHCVKVPVSYKNFYYEYYFCLCLYCIYFKLQCLLFTKLTNLVF